MPDMTVAKRADASTAATRRVEGNRRIVEGTLTQPQNKYATGGFTVTPASLGFDNKITALIVACTNSTGKALAVAVRTSDSSWSIKFFSAIGTELANESETMKELSIEFYAVGN